VTTAETKHTLRATTVCRKLFHWHIVTDQIHAVEKCILLSYCVIVLLWHILKETTTAQCLYDAFHKFRHSVSHR
jgi:hypothetical protein